MVEDGWATLRVPAGAGRAAPTLVGMGLKEALTGTEKLGITCCKTHACYLQQRSGTQTLKQ